MHRLVLATLTLVFWICSFEQLSAQQESHPIATEVAKHKNAFQRMVQTPLLQLSSQQEQWGRSTDNEVSKAAFFDLQSRELMNIMAQPPQLLTLDLPTAEGPVLQLELTQAEIFSPDFQVRAASRPDAAYPYQPGVYYWGIVRGDEHSLAAIAIHRGEVMGTINVDGQSYTLGRLPESEQGTHVLYRKADMKKPSEFECMTDDDKHFIGSDRKEQTPEKDAGNCVRMYIEVDYDIYQGKGGVTQAADYVNGVFSQVAILYANESINFVVNEILVWDVVDPYTGPSTSDYLNQFRNNLAGNYNGDLAHLVGYNGSGGIAYVDVLCNGYYGVAYSDINSSYNQVPTYSWTVEVVTHEIGHNLGSRHTHACAWNGNNTAIDGCGPAAGYSEGCNAPVPDKGTIMSYCHLVSGVGIDFNLGFGPQPGDLIRNRVYNANCLSACAPATTDDAGITSIDAPTGTLCEASLAPQVVLHNYGTNSLTSVTINYQLDGGVNNTYNWSGSLASGSSTTVTLPTISFAVGSHTFDAQTSNPNGTADSNTQNDGASSSFTRSAQQTYYADTDGDGYGDPNNSVQDCSAPNGFVSDNTDCNDNDASAYPGAVCDDGNACTTGDVLDSNCNCSGTFTDSDGDGICDANDVCPGGDDSIDTDGDGIPDACDCNVTTASFTDNPLTHSGSGSSATTHIFGMGSSDPEFTINGLDAKIDGKPSNRYNEQVTVSYVNGSGSTVTYGTFDGATAGSVFISISGTVESVTVSLADGYDGNANQTLSVTLETINYCGPDPGCPDADNDGVCDVDDQCPNFNDNLIGTSCDDGDACTVNDVYGSDCLCAGTFVDSDGDGVCDADDICPGGDDSIDTNGNGVPDFCDDSTCPNEITSSFSPNPLTHSGSGSATSSVSFPANNAEVVFTISGMDAKLGGKPEKRYNEVVTVTYVDGSGSVQTYGTYGGDAVSSVNVSIAGAVQSVTVSLTDGYDGDSGTEEMSIDLGTVTSCVNAASTDASNEGTNALPAQHISLYPNPAGDYALLSFNTAPVNAQVVVRNVLGAKVAEYRLQEQSVLRLPVNAWDASSQVYLITIYQEGRSPMVKKLMIAK